MKIHGRRFEWLVLVATAALVVAAASAAQVTYAPVPSEVWVEGTSTLHDWRVEGGEIDGTITVRPELLGEAGEDGAIEAAASVRIPVKGLESGKSKMNELMYRALEAEEHPFITYRLDEFERLGRQDGAVRFAAKGRLTVAGETRPSTLRGTVTVLDDGDLSVEAATTLRMTDFGIEPPKAMLGTIKTGDEIQVGFRWRLAPGADGEGS